MPTFPCCSSVWSLSFLVRRFYPLLCNISHCITAYATNPSEASFRIFLTELSFRHHLSRLDHSSDDREAAKTSQNGLHSTSNGINNSPSSFQFANRASLSLRTPKHVFHSFGIFTIAAIVPLTRAEREALNASLDRDGSMISDSWFIGAFGRWWRGGIIEAWYQDVVARPSPEEGRSSGILGMKALDRLHGHHGTFFVTRTMLPPHAIPFIQAFPSLIEIPRCWDPLKDPHLGYGIVNDPRNGTPYQLFVVPLLRHSLNL